MKKLLVVLLILLCSTEGFARSKNGGQVENPLEKDLIAAEKGFVDAAKRGDMAFFRRSLTDDFSFVSSDGQLYERQDMLDQFAGGGINLLPYDMKVVAAGDGVAIVTYDVVVRIPPTEDQGPPPRYQHFSTVWVKQGDVWKMKFQQMSVSHWGDW
jgi:ketosteroid isomerase-like protein